MKYSRIFSLGVSAIILTGCFTTNNHVLIPKYEGVQIGTEDLTFCLNSECVTAPYVDGLYSVDNPFGADSQSVAFTPLTIVNDRQIYIAQLTEKNDDDAAYHLARQVLNPTAKTGDIEAVILDCDLSKEQMTEFSVKSGYAPGTCEPADLTGLKTLILSIHGDDLKSEDWWAKNKQPLE